MHSIHGYTLNQLKNIKRHRPPRLQIYIFPNGSMQHFGNDLHQMRSDKEVPGFAPKERGLDLYSTL